ncbi:hypothetical protein D3C77_344380 [compost metagenome]
MRLPVAGADLVADQGIAGAFVRDTQQGFGQAHQGHTFLRRQGKLLQQALDDTGTAASALLVTQFFGDAGGQLVGGLGHGRRQARLLQQHWHHFRLRTAIGGSDGRAQYRLREDAFGKFEEALVAVIAQHFTGFIAIDDRLTVEFGQGGTTLELLQVIEDRLLDQPVRCAVNGLRSCFESLTGWVVKFDPKGGRRHFLSSLLPQAVA